MKKVMKKNISNKGFTLVELIVVIAILGVLMAVLVPQYMQYVEKSKIGVDESYIGEVCHNMELICATNNTINSSDNKVVVTLIAGDGKINYVADSEIIKELAQVFPNQFTFNKKGTLTGNISEGKVFKSKEYTTGDHGKEITLSLTPSTGKVIITPGDTLNNIGNYGGKK